MPAKSEAQQKAAALALQAKKGKVSVDSLKGAAKKMYDSMSAKELEKYASTKHKNIPEKVDEEEVNEATTSASSGAFEAPFGVSSKSELKMLDNLKEDKVDITLEQFESIIIKTLIKEEVYSEKPSTNSTGTYNQTGEEKGKIISTKNAKNQKTYDSKAGKSTSTNTKASGDESKKATEESIEKVAKNQSNNMRNANVIDVNKDNAQNEDQRIEAYQNGMQDLTYDNISDAKQKKNTEYLKNQPALDDPNAQDTGIPQQMIDDAKKRKKSKEDSKFRTAKIYGSDVEYIDGAESAQTKKLAYENTMKRLKFKTSFKDDKDMLSRIPTKYKNNDTMFEMYDGENKYKIRWEGNKTTGVGVILEHRNEKQENLMYERMMHLSNFGKSEKSDFSTMTSKEIFTNMLNEAKGLAETSHESQPKKKIISEEAALVADKRDNEYAINKREIVKFAQQLLNIYTGLNLVVDGIAGKKTGDAIQKFHDISGGDANKRELSKSDFIKLFKEATGNQIGIVKGFDWKIGSRGEEVMMLQILLNVAMGANLKVDGIYGKNTANAVKKFNQSSHIKNNNASSQTFLTAYNLAIDKISGYLGEGKSGKVNRRLNEAWNAQRGLVGKGQQNYFNDVRAAQVALNNVLNTNLVVDGKYGKNTEAAIQKFVKKLKSQEPNAKGILDKANFHSLLLYYLKGKPFKSNLGYKQSNDKSDIYKLQILLNGAGAKLLIDGVFGKKTLAAIVALNKKYFSNTKNKYVITPQQYNKLFGLAMQ